MPCMFLQSPQRDLQLRATRVLPDPSALVPTRTLILCLKPMPTPIAVVYCCWDPRPLPTFGFGPCKVRQKGNYNGDYTHRLLSSSFLGLPYRILNMNHKKELLRSLWVGQILDPHLLENRLGAQAS